jgi:hypothetical protein
MHRFSIAIVAAVIALIAAAAAGAGQRPQDVFTFSDPFEGEFDCGTFVATLSGHDNGRVTTYFNKDGDPIKQIGQIKAIEIDVNPITGKSIEVTTNLMVHFDFATGTTTITGIRNLSTTPGEGVVVQHVGRVVTNSDDEQIFLAGKFPEFEEGYMNDDWCAALS